MLVFVLTAGLLAGCGKKSADNTESKSNVSETFSNASEKTSSTDELSALEQAAAKYGADYTGEPVKLTFWYLTTRQDGCEALTEIWNKMNPNIQVTVSYYDTDGIKDACKTAAQSNSMPSMWFNWGGALGQYYVDNGLTYDLTKYAEEHKWSENE